MPWLLFRESPALLNSLLKAKTIDEIYEKKLDFVNDEPTALSEEEFICYDFMISRLIGLQKNDNILPMTVIMPLVDYFKHDYRGENYAFEKDENNNDALFLTFKNYQPFPEERTSYAAYGQFDSIDTFIGYGFVSYNQPFIYSIPMKIEIPGTDGLIIESRPGMHTNKVPERLKDIARFLPIVSQENDSEAIKLSCLVIPLKPTANAMRRILRAAIRTLAGKYVSKEFVFEQVLEAEKLIIETNINFYDDLLEEIKADNTTADHLKEKIRAIADAQLNKLYKYVHIDNIHGEDDLEEELEEEAEAKNSEDARNSPANV
jgi:hypothetical protein